MLKSCLALGAAAAMFAFMSSSASAAPMTPLGTGTPAVDSQVLNVHGWHPWCEWGPLGRHRHSPGVGRVRCGGGGDGDGYDRCHRWRRECRDRWGGGGDYRRCMRRHGC